MPSKAEKKRMGRPSIFTEKLGLLICTRLADGESLRAICAEEGMPHRKTIRAWTYSKPDFAAQYARARADGMFAIAEKALERAETATQDNAAAVRVYVDTVKWFASKMAPAVFGDKLSADIKADVTHNNEQPVSTLQLARDIAFALHLGVREAAEATTSEESDSQPINQQRS